MRRRQFISLLGGAAAAWPLAARAQQPGKLPTIGFLGATPSAESQRLAAFVQRLRELGWTENRTITIEYRWAEGREERFAEIAAEFARLKVDVIVTVTTPASLAAKQATAVIPIVFAAVSDPVGTGLVASLARPGGNVTGLANQISDTGGKKLELLREVVPGLRRLAIMANVGNPASVLEMGEAQATARTLGLEVITSEIRRAEDIAPAFEALKGDRADALYLSPDQLMNTNRTRINILAVGARLPTMSGSREYVEAGGLMSYGTNLPDQFRRAADYVDKILRGTKPGDIPVEQPTKFELVINLTTARLSARAQQPAMPVIGYLSSRSPDETAHLVAAFRRGLGENGFVEGQNVTIEYRWALGQYDRLPAMASELVRHSVTVLTTTGGEPSAFAAKAATSTIPIVFTFGDDPVQQGLVASYNRPGGNATGVRLLTTPAEPKRLGLLRELVPQATTIGVLLNPARSGSASQLSDVQEAVRMLNLQVHILQASTDREVESAFEAVAAQGIHALAVAGDPFFDTRREKLVALAARHAVPTIYQFREYAVAGGLMSYGVDASDAYRLVGVYTGRVLKGVKPADLPVIETVKFQFVINLKTAKALGVKISDNLLSLADEVIE